MYGQQARCTSLNLQWMMFASIARWAMDGVDGPLCKSHMAADKAPDSGLMVLQACFLDLGLSTFSKDKSQLAAEMWELRLLFRSSDDDSMTGKLSSADGAIKPVSLQGECYVTGWPQPAACKAESSLAENVCTTCHCLHRDQLKR